MRKALDARGGVVKERDGFEIFYGVEPKQRARRRTSTGDTTASKEAAAQVASATQQAPDAATAEKGSIEKKRPPNVPSLKLGGSNASKQSEVCSSHGNAKPAKPERSRRLTAPPSVATAGRTEPQHPMAGIASAAVAAFSAIEAATADGVAAVVDAAMGTTPATASTAPVSARGLVADVAPIVSSFQITSPRLTDTLKQKAPRGVPHYALTGASQKAQLPLPEGVESYSLASPTNSPREPSPTKAPGCSGGEPEHHATPASTNACIDAAVHAGESCEDARSDPPVAARAEIPRLMLARVPE